jgi:hypothetical protein
MKKILIFMLLCLLLCCCAKHKVSDKNRNSQTILKYAGTYSYGQDDEESCSGIILIYPDTDNTLLFYVDVCRGEPSYNMGSLYGSVKIINDSGVFYKKSDFSDIGCKWKFEFSKNNLSIKTIDSQCDCGFGNAVFVDGEYKKNSDTIPDYFENMDSKKIFFKNTKPEEYYKVE